ncbi:MAG TPA: rubrerythrin family protein [Ruminiclostridium sp.]|jgi:rubrerythrin|uniref:Rubrerythrin family protein n=1 Tax=Acetivibrio saccincola TaxID=1677857 RepID=A0A2K9EBD7_9FIRM|nr:rubrerythrin family protein [Acetivibrio saccincola]HAA43293.1 rubrerythrin family protein [Ruminiclostridium sp.]AUG57474.1 Rubrerythrin-1 [Acetivibrio saccincola]NLW27240.1 rubrerythrin family protein [Acetivibrio saccincola]PQQ67395.1 rubrerythrin family protein [Acetivibrio saccincola]HQD29700.1 rubrerythrin family protein [Acetivibrio saccincola]
MKSLKGTKTVENLMKAFAGESQARNRYTYYASVARKEGYKQIEAIFLETADHEKEHAKRFYKFLLEGLEGELPAILEVNATYPVAQGTTLDNLLAAADGENEEWAKLYPAFADVAEEEGFPEIAAAFRMISKSEEQHEIRYRKLAENVKENKVFKKDQKIVWRCRNCGYVHEGDTAPELCPACIHPQAHFEVFMENY